MKSIILKYGHVPCLLYIGVFFCCFYNYHLLYTEQLQVFQFTRLYAETLIGQPGGITAWLGEFVMQFYCINHLAGLVITAVLLTLFMLQRRLLQSWRLPDYQALCLLPVGAFALFFLGTQAQVGAALSVVVALGTVWGVGLIQGEKVRLLVSLLLIPAVYWCTGGGCLVYAGLLIVGNLLSGKVRILFLLAGGLLALTIPLATRLYLMPLSWSETWLGDGFFRTATLPGKIWLLLFLPVVVPVLARIAGRVGGQGRRAFVTHCILFLFITGGIAGALQQKRNQSEETLYTLDYLMKKEEWKQLIQVAEKNPCRNQLFTSYLNLALSHENLLADRLFSFAQHPGVNEFWTSAWLPMYLTGELYYQLDMYNASRAYLFMANTQSPKGLSPAMCKRLAEVEIIRGNTITGMKYIRTLKHTLFYRAWAERMEHAVLSSHYPEELQRKIDSYRPNDAFLAKELLYNVAEKHRKDPDNRKVTDFLLVKYMLANDYKGFIYHFSRLPDRMKRELPRSYQEFLLMYAYMVHDTDLVKQWGIGNEVVNSFYQYLQINQSDLSPELLKQKLGDAYAHSYWFYAQYKNEF